MFPEALELVVVTPERQLIRDSVVEVQLPGAEGCLGILPGHAPLMTELGIGELFYRNANANRTGSLAVIRGFAEVTAARAAVQQARTAFLGATDERLAQVSRVNNFDLTGIAAAVRCVSHFRGHTQEIIHMTRELLGDKYQFAGPK